MINLYGVWNFADEPPAALQEGYGYAFHNRETTGGDGAELVEVDTAAEYIAALADSNPLSIKVTANINHVATSGSTAIKGVRSNKTIWSADGKQVNGISHWIGTSSNPAQSNIKFKNIVIGNPGFDTDAIHFGYGSNGIFLNHVTAGATHDYWNDDPLAAEGSVNDYDGTIDADGFYDVTVANSKFYMYDKLMLMLGNTTGHRTGVTMYNNFFGDIRQRCPSVTNIDLHFFNNVMNNTRGGSQILMHGDTRVLFEYNYLDDAQKVIFFSNVSPGARIDSRVLTTNTLTNGSVLMDATSNTVIYETFNPPYSLPAGFIKTASEARAWILAQSGATLAL